MKMPQLHSTTLLKAFLKLGFIEKNRDSSHIKVFDPNNPIRYAAIPNHRSTTISPGTLRNILRSTQISVDELEKVI